MARYVLRRLAMLVAALLVSSFVIFAGLQLAPGSPLAALSGGRSLPPAAEAALRARYHLDDPFLAQYWHWLTAALHGDLGRSIALRENVSTIIGQRIGLTAELVALAGVIGGDRAAERLRGQARMAARDRRRFRLRRPPRAPGAASGRARRLGHGDRRARHARERSRGDGTRARRYGREPGHPAPA